MEISKKQMDILNRYFKVTENIRSYELESWTNCGVDMFIYIDKLSNDSLEDQLDQFVDSFDIDEVIDIHREDSNYRETFKIETSLEDFKYWINNVEEIIKELRQENEKYIYIIREDMYKDWSWECGACELLGASENKNTAIQIFKKAILNEASINDGDNIFDMDDLVYGKDISCCLDEYIKDVDKELDSNPVYLDIYTSEYDYDNGSNSGTIVIEKIRID